MATCLLPPHALDVPPYRLTGTVYGALLNHRAQLVALGEAASQPPYKAPPQAPVLAVRPRHMLAADGDPLRLPAGFEALEAGPSLGIVIGRAACRVRESQALSHVAGYLLAGEVRLPLASHYRPAVRFVARDGFCPLSTRFVLAAQVPQPDALQATVHVDGECVQRTHTGDRLRGVARLIADVTEFMTLQPGDLLLLGASHGAPQARAGQRITLAIEGLGQLSHTVSTEEEPA